jgi:antitoxin component YwqK of YwqJK toxin-antitoxin module
MKSLILMFLLIIASNVFCQKRYLNTVMIFEDVNSKKIRNQKSSFDFNEIQFNLFDNCYYFGNKRNRYKISGVVTGEFNKYIPNSINNVQVEFYFKDGVKHGVQKYFKNNELWKEEFYENGLAHGISLIYCDKCPSHHIVFKGEYYEDELNNSMTSYYCNANINYTGKFMHGLRIGKHQKFYKNGTLQSEEIYNDSISSLIFSRDWNERGQLIREKFNNDEYFKYDYYHNGPLKSITKTRKILIPTENIGLSIVSEEVYEKLCLDENGISIDCQNIKEE